MRGNNVIVLMSDEHTRSVMGAYGNPLVHTPDAGQTCRWWRALRKRIYAIADLYFGTRQLRHRHPGVSAWMLVVGGTLLRSATKLDASAA